MPISGYISAARPAFTTFDGIRDIVLLFTDFIRMTASIATNTSVITNANHTILTVPIFDRMIAEVSMIASCITEVISVFLLLPSA